MYLFITKRRVEVRARFAILAAHVTTSFIFYHSFLDCSFKHFLIESSKD